MSHASLPRINPRFVDLMRSFAETLPTRIDAIRAAVDAGDHDEVARLVDDLGKRADGYGFPRISTVAMLWNLEEADEAIAELEILTKLEQACVEARTLAGCAS